MTPRSISSIYFKGILYSLSFLSILILPSISFGATPSISIVAPNFGPSAGGASVKILGTSFETGATVRIGGNLGTVTNLTATELTVTVPAGLNGPRDVVVTNPGDLTSTLTGGFIYQSALAGSAVEFMDQMSVTVAPMAVPPQPYQGTIRFFNDVAFNPVRSELFYKFTDAQPAYVSYSGYSDVGVQRFHFSDGAPATKISYSYTMGGASQFAMHPLQTFSYLTSKDWYSGNASARTNGNLSRINLSNSQSDLNVAYSEAEAFFPDSDGFGYLTQYHTPSQFLNEAQWAKIRKVTLSNLATAGYEYSLASGESFGPAVLGGVEKFIFVTSAQAGQQRIEKLVLGNFAVNPPPLQRTASITLNAGEQVASYLADTTGGFIYLGLTGSPAKVVKIRLSDFSRISTLTLGSNSGSLEKGGFIKGEFAYFFSGNPVRMTQIRLSNFSSVGVYSLNSNFLGSFVDCQYDPVDNFLYVMGSNDINTHMAVAKLRVAGSDWLPTFTSVYPNFGLTTGGTSLYIAGTKFQNGATITIGGVPATGVTVSNTSGIQCTAPAGTSGPKTIVITNPDGNSVTVPNGFTYYVLPPPTITNVSPGMGPTEGGTPATINGTNFVSGATIKLKQLTDGPYLNNVVFANSAQLTAVTPPNLGNWAVVVTNPDGQQAFLGNAFQYIPKPVVTAVTPNFGPTSGGTTIKITGNYFIDTAAVSVGGKPAAITSVTATEIVATVPAGLLGSRDIVVTNPANQSATISGGFIYTSQNPGISLNHLSSAQLNLGPVPYQRHMKDWAYDSVNNLVLIRLTDWSGIGTIGESSVRRYSFPSGTKLSNFNCTVSNDAGASKLFIDPLRQFAYVTYRGYNVTSTGGLQKIRLSDYTNQGTQTYDRSDFLYFDGTGFGYLARTMDDSSGKMSKVNLSNLTTVGTPLTLPFAETFGPSFIPLGPAHILTINNAGTNLGIMDLATSVKSPGFTLPSNEQIVSFALDHQNNFLYVGVNNNVGWPSTPTYVKILKLSYPILTLVDTLTLPISNESELLSKGAFYFNGYAYFFTGSTPARLHQINLSNFSKSATYTLPLNRRYAQHFLDTVSVPGEGFLYIFDTSGGTTSETETNVLKFQLPREYTPTIASLSPNVGATSGGTILTINGTNFEPGATVTIGGTPVTTFVGFTSTQIKAVVPAGTMGVKDIVVTNSDGRQVTLTAAFTYLLPQLTSISPSSGYQSGGYPVTLYGSGFSPAATIKVGTQSVYKISQTNDTQIIISMPNCPNYGFETKVDIEVTNPDGKSSKLPSAFTYIGPPGAFTVSPNWSLPDVQTPITLTGSGFMNGATVKIGNVAATNVVFVDARHLTALAPLGTPGSKDVTVTNPDGLSKSIRNAFSYTAPPGPFLTYPNFADTAGGSKVTLIGSNFKTNVTVHFDGILSPSITRISDTKIEAVAPAHADGWANVKVTNVADGVSQTIPNSLKYFTLWDNCSFNRVDGSTPPFSNYSPIAIDAPQGFAYYSVPTSPAKIVKIRISDLTEQGTLTLAAGEDNVNTGVLDSSRGYAYLGTNTSPAKIVRVKLSDFTRVDAVTLSAGENMLRSSVIDDIGGFAYFGTDTIPGKIVRVDLNNFSTAGLSVKTLNAGEDQLRSAVFDPKTRMAYFGTATFMSRVIKINTADFMATPSVSIPTLANGVYLLSAATIDSEKGFAYFAGSPNKVLKIKLADFSIAGDIVISPAMGGYIRGAAIDPANKFAYFSWDYGVGQIIQVRLDTFSLGQTVTMSAGEIYFSDGILKDDISGNLLVGFQLNPARVAKVSLMKNGCFSLSGVSPTSGYVDGGYPVTINGANILSGSVVTIGGIAADVLEQDANHITVLAPVQTAGSKNIVVSNSFGRTVTLSNAFTYLGPPPGIFISNPAEGPVGGGTSVMLIGEDFQNGCTVKVGNANAASVQFINRHMIKIVTPSGAAGNVYISVTNPDGQASTNMMNNRFTYFQPQSGTNFQRVDAIYFGTATVAAVAVDPKKEFLYAAVNTLTRSEIKKIQISNFQIVGSITLPPEEFPVTSALIGEGGWYGYFGTRTTPGRVVKIWLPSFYRVNAITLPSGLDNLGPAVIDNTKGYAFFGTQTNPSKLVTIRLSNDQISSLTLTGKSELSSGDIDPSREAAYFSTLNTNELLKIRLAWETTPVPHVNPQLVGSVSLGNGMTGHHPVTVDRTNGFVYTTLFSDSGLTVVLVDTAFVKRASVLLNDISLPGTSIFDDQMDKVYFGNTTFGTLGSKVFPMNANASGLTSAGSPASLNSDEWYFPTNASAIDTMRGHLYLGSAASGQTPGYLVKVAVPFRVNHAPASSDAYYENVPGNVAFSFSLFGSDPDNDAIIFTTVTSPVNGRLSGTAPNLTYIPNAGFTGVDRLEYYVSDGKLNSKKAHVEFGVGVDTLMVLLMTMEPMVMVAPPPVERVDWAASQDGSAPAVAQEPQPVITTLSQMSGPLQGGTVVILSGLNFNINTQIQFGNKPGLSLTYVDDHTLKVMTPASKTKGTVSLSVINGPAAQTTLTNAFTYVAAAEPKPVDATLPGPTVDSPSKSASAPAGLALTAVKNLFNPSKGDTAIFRIQTNQSGTANLTLYDRNGKKVRTLPPVDMSAGQTSDVQWDGRDDNGSLVASGTYNLIVRHNGSSPKKLKIVVIR